MTIRNMKLALVLCCGAAVLGSSLAIADPAADAMKKAKDAAQKAGQDAKDAAGKAAKDAMGGTGGAGDKSHDDAAMMAMIMKLAEPSEHHKIIQQFEGTWDAEVKTWMDPSQKEPMLSRGTLTVKLTHGGRYAFGDFKGSFAMPGPDGKMQDMPITGTHVWGYNNVENRYESTWNDSMSTGIMMSVGQPSADGQTVDSTAEFRMPGPDGKMMQIKQREKMAVVSKDKYVLDMWHNDGTHGEMKVMEITYTRATAAKPMTDKPMTDKPMSDKPTMPSMPSMPSMPKK